MPKTTEDMIVSASSAIVSGGSRQRIDLLLPINEKKYNFLAIESMDYPCSLMEEFKTAVEVSGNLLKSLNPSGKLLQKRIDAGVDGDMLSGGEGDPTMLMRTEGFAAFVFPFAENLNQIQELCKGDDVVLIINPQWRNSGQIVSDFGFGPWKKKADDFLATFETTFSLTESRIGAPSSLSLQDGRRYSDGGVVRVMRNFPEDYRAYVMAVDGAYQEIGRYVEPPTYDQLDKAIKEGREKNLDIFEYAKDAKMPNPFAQSNLQAAGDDTIAQVESLDKTSIRQALEKRGLPTSGTMATIKQRLKDALTMEAGR